MLFNSAKRLMKQAYVALQRAEYDQALALARKLRSMHHTSTFEIAARAFWAAGKADAAIAQLGEGVKVAPQLPILWEYLGCYYSDLGRYSEAETALKRGLDCPGAVATIFHYNLAILYERWGRLDQAFEATGRIICAECLGPPPAAIAELRARLLIAQGSYVAAFEEATRGLELLKNVEGQDFGTTLSPQRVESELLTHLGRSLWLGHGDREAALTAAFNAVACNPKNADAARLIRDVHALYSPRARRMNILFLGRWHEKDKQGRALGFYIRYVIFADSPDEALAFAKTFEPKQVRDSLIVESWEEIPGDTSEPKGVCSITTGHCLFPEGS